MRARTIVRAEPRRICLMLKLRFESVALTAVVLIGAAVLITALAM